MTISVEPGMEKLETVKFILQPFVENVLEHAWYDDEITIDIRLFREGNHMVMEVIDNGLGMKQETISQIMGTGGDRIGYGIRNVDQRIKLHYGKEYGVSLTSRIGEGTIVHIVLPTIPCESKN
ncbi:Sensor histidine kinase YehU [compost metagenome]